MLIKRKYFLISLLAFTAFSPAFAMMKEEDKTQRVAPNNPVLKKMQIDKEVIQEFFESYIKTQPTYMVKRFAEMDLDLTVECGIVDHVFRKMISQAATESMCMRLTNDLGESLRQIRRVTQRLNMFTNPLPEYETSESYQQNMKQYFNTEHIGASFTAQLCKVRDALKEPVSLMEQLVGLTKEVEGMPDVSYGSLTLGVGLLANQYRMEHSLDELFKLKETEGPLIKATKEKDTIEGQGILSRFLLKYEPSGFIDDLKMVSTKLDCIFDYLSPHDADIMSLCVLERTQLASKNKSRVSMYWPIDGSQGTQIVLNFNDIFLRQRQKVKSLQTLVDKIKKSDLKRLDTNKREQLTKQIKIVEICCKPFLHNFSSHVRKWRRDFIIDTGKSRRPGPSWTEYMNRYYTIKANHHFFLKAVLPELEPQLQNEEKDSKTTEADRKKGSSEKENKKKRNTTSPSDTTSHSSVQIITVSETEMANQRYVEPRETHNFLPKLTDENISSPDKAKLSKEEGEGISAPSLLQYSLLPKDDADEKEKEKEDDRERSLEPQGNYDSPPVFTDEDRSSLNQVGFPDEEEESINEKARYEQCQKWLVDIIHTASNQNVKEIGILYRASSLARDLKNHPVLLEQIEQATSELALRLQSSLGGNSTTKQLKKVSYVPESFEADFNYFFETPITYLKGIRFGFVKRLLEGLGGTVDTGRAGSRIHFTLKNEKTSIHLHDATNGQLDGGRITNIRKLMVDAGLRLKEK